MGYCKSRKPDQTWYLSRYLCTAVIAVLLCLPGIDVYADEENDSTATVLTTELFADKKTRINGYPYAYYTPETQLAFGVGGIATFYTAKDALLRPSKTSISAYYATTGQWAMTLTPQVYLARNLLFASARLEIGEFVDKYWGIGNTAPDIDNAAYEYKGWRVELGFQWPPLTQILKNDKVGSIVDIRSVTITDRRDNPWLQPGVTFGEDGGLNVGLGAVWVWDTRDHVFYPASGVFSKVEMVFYSRSFGSDYDFNTYDIDLRFYHGLDQAKERVMAYQVLVNLVRSHPPFYELAALGGSTIMRGYFTGRYRDRNYYAGQVELRSHLWQRFGFVAFAGAGDVASDHEDLHLRGLKYTIGVGLRFKFNPAEKVNLRCDFGFGKNTSGVYFGLEEAF
jgi:hypothetical protein